MLVGQLNRVIELLGLNEEKITDADFKMFVLIQDCAVFEEDFFPVGLRKL